MHHSNPGDGRDLLTYPPG